MLFHRSKTSARTGRRSVRGGAIFASLALATGSILGASFLGASAASADGCAEGDSVSALHHNYCYTISTSVQPGTEVALGTAVHDDATVIKAAPVCEDAVGTLDNCIHDETSTKTYSVTFQLFTGNDCGVDESGTQIGSDQVVNLGGDAATDPGTTVSSDSSTLAAGDYSYLATFTVVHGLKTEVTLPADCEPFTVDQADPTVTTDIHNGTNHTTPVTTVAFDSTVHDAATVAGVTDFTPTGDVSFTFFKNGECSGSGTTDEASVALDAGVADGSAPQGPLAAGDYSFKASYAGDSNYTAADGPCEPLTVAAEDVVVPVAVAGEAVSVSPAVAVAAAPTFTG